MKYFFFSYLLTVTAGLAAPMATPDASPPKSPPPSATVAPPATASQSTPMPSLTPGAAESTASEKEKKPAKLYDLDYDEEKDLFLVPGTQEGYTGPVFSLYDNGKRELDGFLLNGQRDGWWTEYTEEGQKSSAGAYKSGAEDGWWTYWHENGQVQSQGNYRKGSTIGEWKSFFENGKPDSQGIYKDGLMNGPWTFHDEETGEARTIRFDMGVQLR